MQLPPEPSTLMLGRRRLDYGCRLPELFVSTQQTQVQTSVGEDAPAKVAVSWPEGALLGANSVMASRAPQAATVKDAAVLVDCTRKQKVSKTCCLVSVGASVINRDR